MIGFIDDHRDVYGVEPICRLLPIAPSIARQAIAKQSAERGRITIVLSVAPIQPGRPHVSSGMRFFARKSSGFGTRITKSMACARPGIS